MQIDLEKVRSDAGTLDLAKIRADAAGLPPQEPIDTSSMADIGIMEPPDIPDWALDDKPGTIRQQVEAAYGLAGRDGISVAAAEAKLRERDALKAVQDKINKGPIGFWEATIQDWETKVPFSPVGPLQTLDVVLAMGRLKDDKYEAPPFYGSHIVPQAQPAWGTMPSQAGWSPDQQRQRDQQVVDAYLGKLAERAERGYSFWGKVGAGTSELPAFMVEFAATGGLNRLGSEAAKRALETRVKSQLAKRAAAWASGSAARTAGAPQMVAESILARRLSEDTENWATSIAKGWGDVFVEMATEAAGENIAKGLGTVLHKLPFGGKLVDALHDAWLNIKPTNTTAQFLDSMMTKSGYNGMLGEIGEEKLGTILRNLTGIADRPEGYSQQQWDQMGLYDKSIAILQADIQQTPVEATVLAIPGVGRFAVGTMAGQIEKANQSFLKEKEAAAQRREAEAQGWRYFELADDEQAEAFAVDLFDRLRKQGKDVRVERNNAEVRVREITEEEAGAPSQGEEEDALAAAARENARTFLESLPESQPPASEPTAARQPGTTPIQEADGTPGTITEVDRGAEAPAATPAVPGEGRSAVVPAEAPAAPVADAAAAAEEGAVEATLANLGESATIPSVTDKEGAGRAEQSPSPQRPGETKRTLYYTGQQADTVEGLREKHQLYTTQDESYAETYTNDRDRIFTLAAKPDAKILDTGNRDEIGMVADQMVQDRDDGNLSRELDELTEGKSPEEIAEILTGPTGLRADQTAYDSYNIAEWLYDRFGYDGVQFPGDRTMLVINQEAFDIEKTRFDDDFNPITPSFEPSPRSQGAGTPASPVTTAPQEQALPIEVIMLFDELRANRIDYKKAGTARKAELLTRNKELEAELVARGFDKAYVKAVESGKQPVPEAQMDKPDVPNLAEKQRRMAGKVRFGESPAEQYQREMNAALSAFGAAPVATVTPAAEPTPATAPAAQQSESDFDRAVQLLLKSLRKAQRVSVRVAAEKSTELSRRVGKAAPTAEELIAQGVPAREAMQRSTGALKGELTTYEQRYDSVRDELGPQTIEAMHRQIALDSKLRYFERLRLQELLDNLIDGTALTLHQARMLGDYFGKDVGNLAENRVPYGDKFWQVMLELLNIPRTILASVDMSGILRQGRALVQANPEMAKEFAENYAKAFAQEDFAVALENSYKNSPDYDDAKDANLEMPEWGRVDVGIQELSEEFAGARWLQKIPGVRASERSFVTALNALRLAVYTKLRQQTEQLRGRPMTLVEKRHLASRINNLSGRTSLPRGLRELAPILNAVFFSPRFALSRFALLRDIPVSAFYSMAEVVPEGKNGRPKIKQWRLEMQPELVLTLKAVASTMATNLTVMALVAFIAGDDDNLEMEMDPRATDFGKIRFGDFRLDLWAGYAQAARFMARFATGQTKTASGEVRELDREDAFKDFLQTKESPLASLISDWWTGENMVGKPFLRPEKGGWLEQVGGNNLGTGIAQELWDRFTPLIVQDVTSALLIEGIPEAVTAGTLGFLGAGVQTYERSGFAKAKDVKNAAAEARFGNYWDDLTPSQQESLREDQPQIDAAELQAKREAYPVNTLDLTEMRNTAQRIHDSLPPAVQRVLNENAINTGVGRTIGDRFWLNEKRYKEYERRAAQAIEVRVREAMNSGDDIKKAVDAARQEARESLVQDMEAGLL